MYVCMSVHDFLDGPSSVSLGWSIADDTRLSGSCCKQLAHSGTNWEQHWQVYCVLLRTQGSPVSIVKLFRWAVLDKAASSNTRGHAIDPFRTGTIQTVPCDSKSILKSMCGEGWLLWKVTYGRIKIGSKAEVQPVIQMDDIYLHEF